MVGGIAIIAAGTGIHRRHEHEGAGIFYSVFGAGDGNPAVFERLAHNLKDGTVELGKLVAEKDTVVGKGNLARLGIVAASDKGD